MVTAWREAGSPAPTAETRAADIEMLREHMTLAGMDPDRLDEIIRDLQETNAHEYGDPLPE